MKPYKAFIKRDADIDEIRRLCDRYGASNIWILYRAYVILFDADLRAVASIREISGVFEVEEDLAGTSKSA